LAASGIVDDYLLEMLQSDPFFEKKLPKTIGPELFNANWVQSALTQLPKGMPGHNPNNLMATLARLTAQTAAEAIIRTIKQQESPNNAPNVLYLSGGGAHNPRVVGNLQQLLVGWEIRPMATLGIPGDAKEAVLFALLANETVAGHYPKGATLGGLPLVKMGKICLPD
jgi:anhydro-N-acetylmuramic acid kinase